MSAADMPTFTTIYRGSSDDREAPNATGYFVQRNGVTVAGPFVSRYAAWEDEDQRRADARETLEEQS